jgi:tetratricopeptide (TPR) repeat protein
MKGKDRDEAIEYFNRGVAKAELGKYEEAIKDYDRAIEEDPDFAVTYCNRGIAKAELGKYEEAIQDFDIAIEKDPNYAKVYCNRGTAKSYLKKYEEAIEDYDRAIEKDPNFASAYNNRGNAKSDLKAYKGAIEDYNIAIEKDPDYTLAYNGRGNAKSELEKYEKAIKDYDMAIKKDPDFAMAYYNRGLAKLYLKEYEEALEDYNTAIEKDPDYALAYYNRGLAKFILEQYSEAQTDCLTCLYLSIKQKNTQYIIALLPHFDAYPQNIKYAFDSLELDLSSFTHLQSAYGKIEYFELLIECYTNINQLSEREKLSFNAILYYYLGGNVPAFIIFAEQLDIGETPLSAQEFYYYVLTAREINWDKKLIVEDAIQQLEQVEKTDTDLYYLGHLYWLNRQKDEAIKCFEKSAGFIFSELMLNSLDKRESPDIEKRLSSLTLNGEIDPEKINSEQGYLSQFQDYFHLRECVDAVKHKDIVFESDFWVAFTFSETFSRDLHIAQRKYEEETVFKELVKKYERDSKTSLINLTEDEKHKHIEKWFLNVDDEENPLFTNIKGKIDSENLDGEILEKNIAYHITEKKHPAEDFLYFLQHVHLRKKITSEQAFTLTLYLRYCIGKKQFYEAISGIRVPGTTISISPKSARALFKSESIDYDKRTSPYKDYNDYKEFLWIAIRSDMDYLSPEALERKYSYYSWYKPDNN